MSRGPSLGSSIRVKQQFVSTKANMYESLALYIDGEFIAGGGRREQDVHNPASGQAIGRLPHASTEDLDRALATAQRAFETWRSVSPMEKSRILRKVGELTRERAQAIATNITLDQGSRSPKPPAR